MDTQAGNMSAITKACEELYDISTELQKIVTEFTLQGAKAPLHTNILGVVDVQTICGKCECNLSEEEKVFDDIYNCPNCGLEEARSVYKTNVKEYWGEGIDVSKEGSVLLIRGNGAVKDFPDASNNSQILYGIRHL